MSFAFGQATQFDLAEIARFSRVMRTTGKSLHLVVLGQDMHAGHRVLLRTAKQLGVAVAALELPDDGTLAPETLEILRESGVDAVVAYTRKPGQPHSLWPRGLRTQITAPAGLEDPAELAQALTTHLSLVHAVSPETIVAGEKDYEFLLRLQQAVTDLHLPVKVQGVPTVRMPDGLAMSLRNTQIPEEYREPAMALSAALTVGAHVAERGGQAVMDTAAEVLQAAGVQPEYLQLRARDFGPAPEQGDARLLVAASFGGVRLVDNVGVPVGIGFRNLDGDS